MQQKAKPANIFLVDDHPIVRNGLRQLIDRERDLACCGEVGGTQAALAGVVALNPDLVIMDISIEGANGVELTKTLRAQNPGLAILMLSMHDETVYAERCLRAGARGYVMKHEPPDILLKAIRTVLAGGLHVSESIAARMLRDYVNGAPGKESRDSLGRLSDRELEVFEWIGRGLTSRDIADKLHLSVKTIETHRVHIKEKLGIESANELTHRAIHWVQQAAQA